MIPRFELRQRPALMARGMLASGPHGPRLGTLENGRVLNEKLLPQKSMSRKMLTCTRILQCLGQRDLCLRQIDPPNLEVRTSKPENGMFSKASKLAMLRNSDLEFQSAPWLGKKTLKMQESQEFARILPPPAPAILRCGEGPG